MRTKLSVLFFILLVASFASATTYYVSTTGADTNAGTLAAPWLTLQKAANTMVAGDTTIVEDGVYTCPSGTCTGGGTGDMVTASTSGTSGAYITFQAQHQGAAVLDGNNFAGHSAFMVTGNYIRVTGFEIRNFYWFGVAVEGSTNAIGTDIAHNTIHNIGNVCTTSAFGIVGVFVNGAQDTLIEENDIYSVGRYNAGEGTCTSGNTLSTDTHDHGIYLNGTVTSPHIVNNIFHDNTKGWDIQLSGTIDSLTIYNNTMTSHNAAGYYGQIIVPSATTNTTIANNIFYNAVGAAIMFWGGDSGDTWTVTNNLTTASHTIADYNGSTYTLDPTLTGITVTSTLLSTDPLLANPVAYDYHLTSSSPAINAGTTTNAPSVDYDGVTRTGNPDIGAFEYVAVANKGGIGTPVHSYSALPSGAHANTIILLTGTNAGVYRCANGNGCSASADWVRLGDAIGSGSVALPTSSIAASSCSSPVAVSAPGVVSTDVVLWSANADLTAVTGYAPTGSLKIYAYPSANQVTFTVCNTNASSAVTPGAATLNWRVSR